MQAHILDRIKNIEDLPTLPSVALEVLSLAHQTDVSIQSIAECIHRDPPLATKVLRMSNSAFYRRGDRRIETLHHAIIFLGLAEIINITTHCRYFPPSNRARPKRSPSGKTSGTTAWPPA